MEVWKIIFLSKRVIWRFHVNLPGCTCIPCTPNGRPYKCKVSELHEVSFCWLNMGKATSQTTYHPKKTWVLVWFCHVKSTTWWHVWGKLEGFAINNIWSCHGYVSNTGVKHPVGENVNIFSKVAIWYRQTKKNIWKDHLEEELYRKSALLCWWSGMNKLGLIDHNIISGWCSTPTLLLICSSFSMGKWSSIAHDCSSGSSTAQIWIKKHPITFLGEWKS